MAAHADPIVAQVHQEFQELVAYVTGPQAQTSTAYEVELTLFRRLLALGATLLRLFFLTRAARRPAGPVVSPTGRPLAYHDRRQTTYYSVFGKIRFARHAYTAPGQPVVCPLDAALGLPARCYSDLLREWASYSSTDAAYRETQTVLERILGLSLSVQALETSLAEDAVDVGAFYEQPPVPPPPASPATILVAQADGTGVPLVRPPTAPPRPVRRGKGQPPGTKKEAIVTSLYLVAPYPRTPAAIVEALLAAPETPPARPGPRPVGEPADRPRPLGKEVRATLDGKAVALDRLAARVAQHAGEHIQQRVALTDGAAALQQAMQTHLPGHTLVLDIIHATEHLWEAANALLGEHHPDRTAWVRTRLQQMVSGQTAALIADLAQAGQAPTLTAAQRKVVQQTVGYYQRNQPYMRYDEYLAQGWPIGTGVVEGACGHLVQDRLEQAGMRWTPQGAEAVLDLRAVRLNGHWDAYWQFHRQHQQQRLYGASAVSAAPAEADVLERAA
jgi:hypothetical protein